MPIRPAPRFFYPIEWPQLSAVIQFGRAKGCCEGCGRPHGRMVYHLGNGRLWDPAPEAAPKSADRFDPIGSLKHGLGLDS